MEKPDYRDSLSLVSCFSVQVGDVQVEVSLRCPWPPSSGDVSEASTGTGLLRKRRSTGDQAAKAGRRLTVLNMEQLGFLADDDDDDNETQ